MNTLFNWSFSFLPIGDCITKRLVKKREEKEWFLNFHMYIFPHPLLKKRKFFRPLSIVPPACPNQLIDCFLQFQLFVYLHIFMFRPILSPLSCYNYSRWWEIWKNLFVLHLYIVKIVLLGKEKTFRYKNPECSKKIIEQFKKKMHTIDAIFVKY